MQGMNAFFHQKRIKNSGKKTIMLVGHGGIFRAISGIKTFKNLTKMVDLIGSAPNGEPRNSYDEIYAFWVTSTSTVLRCRSGAASGNTSSDLARCARKRFSQKGYQLSLAE